MQLLRLISLTPLYTKEDKVFIVCSEDGLEDPNCRIAVLDENGGIVIDDVLYLVEAYHNCVITVKSEIENQLDIIAKKSDVR